MQLNKKYPLLLNNNYDEQLNNIISNLIIHHLNTKQINNTIMPSNNSHNVVPAPIISNTNTTATIRFYRQMLPKNENEILQLDLNTCSDVSRMSKILLTFFYIYIILLIHVYITYDIFD